MNIAITGGTGSLGKALIKHLLDERTERIVAISRDEQKQETCAKEFGGDAAPIRWFLGDVRDRARMLDAFHGVDVVVHAAALKRVDRIAYNPKEVVKTNVQGTLNVLEAATEMGVPRVLVVSTDKACQAENIYGGTKFLSEQLAVAENAYSYPRGTRCAAVRYGNVWGSRGSVVHVWRDQIRAHEHSRRPSSAIFTKTSAPLVSLTDPEMTRFVITLDQAVAFVMRALGRMRGGEIFVPLLPSIRLTDLVKALRAEYTLIGYRPGGEKVSERLLSDEEPSRTVVDQDVYTVTPSLRSWSTIPYPGEPVDRHLVYSSASNPWFLTVDEIEQLLEDVPI